MDSAVRGSFIEKTFAAEFCCKEAHLFGYDPVEVVAETEVNAVSDAKVAVVLWHSSADPHSTFLVVTATAVIFGLSFL